MNEELKNQINLDRNEISSESSRPEIISSTITEDSRFDKINRTKEHNIRNDNSNLNVDPEGSINYVSANKSNETNIEMAIGGDQKENTQFIAREISTSYEEEDKNLFHEILNTRKKIQLELNKE